MGGEGWITIPFDQAVQVNPTVRLERGSVYPFVDMQAVDPCSRSVGPSESREFKGGGSRFMNGDTLMARITPCLENGKIARYAVPEGKGVGHGSTEFVVIRGKPKVTDNGFAYYLTKWDGVRQYCISQMTGSSGRQRVPTNALSQLEVTIAPLKEQQAIACILGVLDDKIELNRRMNKTLETTARAIFKSWFVDFDPVRIKAAGQHPPGLKPEIAALFPDAFEDSELGKIPKRWRVQSFTDGIDVMGGGTPKTSNPEYWGGNIPWFSVVDTPAPGEVFVIDTDKKITEQGVKNSSTRVLPVGTTIISARGTVGNLALAGVPMAMNQSCYGLCDRRGQYGYFLYYLTEAMVATLRQRTHGSVFNTITRDTLNGVLVVAPPDLLVNAFEHVTGGMLQRILSALFESRSLAALRDALLPELISGKLRVQDAERVIGRVL